MGSILYRNIKTWSFQKVETSQNKVNYAKVEFLIDKPKMAQFLKFKFLIAFKLNFNMGQFFNKYQNMVISKSEKKFEVEHFEHLHHKV